MRALLSDLGAGLLFFAVLHFTKDIYAATVAGFVLGICLICWSWTRGHHIELMQWLSLGLVVAMGGVTIIFHEPRFIMFKPTVRWACLGLLLVLRPGWPLRYIPSYAVTRLPRRFLVAFGIAWALALLGMAAVNAGLAMYASQETWLLYSVLGPPWVFGSIAVAFYAATPFFWSKPKEKLDE